METESGSVVPRPGRGTQGAIASGCWISFQGAETVLKPERMAAQCGERGKYHWTVYLKMVEFTLHEFHLNKSDFPSPTTHRG